MNPQPRFWCPRGEDWYEAGGYLVDPETQYRDINNHLVQSSELAAKPCLVLIGEAGTGKTTEMNAAHRAVMTAGANVRFINLGAVGTGDTSDLFDQVFHNLFQDSSSDGVTLFLDAFDECRVEIRNLGALLSRGFRAISTVERGRLSVRIATRSGVWSPELEGVLNELWPGGVGVYLLTPLREQDVATIVSEKLGLAVPPFMQAVRDTGAVPLAARPLTLKLLLRVFQAGGELPQRREQLFENGCLELCHEHNPSRRDADRTGDLSAEQRLAIARRIAGATILCGRSLVWLGNPSNCPREAVSDCLLAGGMERVPGGEFEVTPVHVREVLQDTGLFTSQAPGLFGWVHRSFGEYLAATYLTAHSVPIPQIINLLFHSADPRRVVPQLRDVAAWLAGIDTDIFRLIVDRDPQPLLLADLSGLTYADRAAAVNSIISTVRQGRMHDGGLGFHQYRRLAHPELARQLEPVIRDRREHFLVRRIAIGIAEATELETLQDVLVDVALDSEDDSRIRAQAARALVDLADAPTRRRMLGLLNLPSTEDPEDQLRGSALRALWKDRLCPLATILEALGPPNAPNFAGAFDRFMYQEFPDSITTADLPAVLEWLEHYRPTGGQSYKFEALGDRLVRDAWNALDYPGVIGPLARAVWARASQFYAVFRSRREDDLPETFGSQDDRRRALLAELLPLTDGHQFVTQTLISAGLVRSQDLEWLVDRLDNRETLSSLRPVLAELIERIFTTVAQPGYDAAIVACTRHPELQKAMEYWFRVIPLDSVEAGRMREAYRQMQEAESRRNQGPPPVSPLPRERIQTCLDRIEAGNDDDWYWLTRELTLEPSSQFYGEEFASDLTVTPGWRESDHATRARMLQAARSFLQRSHPRVAEWFADPETRHQLGYAGFKALRLLHDESAATFAELPSEVWECWLPALLTFPTNSRPEENAAQRRLIAEASRKGRGAVVIWLRRLMDRENCSQFPRGVARLFENCWGEDLAEVLREVIQNREVWARMFPQTLEDLVRRGDARTIDYARNLLQSPLPAEADERRVCHHAASILLAHSPHTAWSAVRGLLDTEPDFASQVLLADAERAPFNVPPKWIGHLTESEVADLYVWLCRRFQPANDPSEEECGLVTPRRAMSHFRDALLTSLRGRGTLEAVAALDRIAHEMPNVDGMHWIRIDAEQRAMEQTWRPPDPSQLFELIRDSRRRLVRSGDELLQVVIESLGRYEAELQGETPGAFTLWDQRPNNTFRPKEENRLSDAVKLHLQRDIGDRGIVANREVEIRAGAGTGERTDVHISATTRRSDGAFDSVRVIVEVKGCWHREVNTAMESQLRDRYLRDNDCRHGLYAVGWFLGDRWSDPDDSRRDDARRRMPPSLEVARIRFEDQSKKLSVGGNVLKAVVINASLR
jgi:hypothetical protein